MVHGKKYKNFLFIFWYLNLFYKKYINFFPYLFILHKRIKTITLKVIKN